MTQKDGSPEASEGPYWSEELLAVLVVGLGDETQAREKAVGSRTAAPPRPTKGRAGDERPDHKPTTEDAMATTSFFLEAIARPSSRKGVTEDDIGWMGPFLQVGGVPGRRL